jgi:hypothetical protein
VRQAVLRPDALAAARLTASRILRVELPRRTTVPKPNYAFEKRQRELEKKRKKEEKAARRKSSGGGSEDAPAEGAPAPADDGAPATPAPPADR